MGVVPCYVGYAVHRLVLRIRQPGGATRLHLASFVAALFAVTAGSVCVPLEAAIAGVITVPLHVFLATMVGVHVLIGAVEGIITFAVIAYVYRVRPDVVEGHGISAPSRPPVLSWRLVLASLAVLAVVTGGLISHVASSQPDGLEWTYAERPEQENFEPFVQEPTSGSVVARVDDWQQRHALLPDYGSDRAMTLTVAGLFGTVLTLVITYLAALLLRRRAA
jgi:cobalt/nickel transport system permease protein